MNSASLSAVLLSVALGACAQMVLKAGVSTPAIETALSNGGWFGILAAFALSPLVWVGLIIYAASALVWLFVLARVDVSVAYPFVGLGFIFTMVLGWGMYGEDVTAIRVLGTLLIASGVAVLAQS